MRTYLFRKIIRRLPGVVIKLVPLPEQIISEGYGVRTDVGRICVENGYQSVLLVTDKTLSSLGFQNKVIESLEKNCISFTVFDNIDSEPNESIIYEGRKAAINCNADCIVALGGGSVLDSSKMIAASSVNCKRKLSSYLRKFVFVRKTVPLITIPSTAGTGAEITVGAVVKNSSGAKKASVIVGLNITNVILDSELTVNAPMKVTASCAIDALSHGLEGCMADIRCTDEDIQKSRECVKLVFENLPLLLDKPNDIEARQKLCTAANYGGNAINKQLAGYVHAFAHSIGGFYHIPHGEAIAMCLLPVVRFNESICTDKLAALAVHCGLTVKGTENIKAAAIFIDSLRDLLLKCGFGNAADMIIENDRNALIKNINSDSINYSPPKTLTDKEISNLLDEIKRGIV